MDDHARDSAILHAILATSEDGIIVADERGVMIHANPVAQRMFGYGHEEMLGQNVRLLMPKEMADNHDAYMARYVDTGEARIIGIGRDVEGQRKNKSVFPLHLSVGEADIDDQRLFIGILHDLTLRRATEAALARSQRLDAVGQMTSGIAHDFNNLLTVLIGNLELLEMKGTDDWQRSFIHDALEAAEIGVELTSGLMAFARQSELKPVETDLSKLCKETLGLIKNTVGPTLTVRTSFAPDVRPVMVDPATLQSALVNLALNARDAMQQDGELLISVSNVTIDDTYIAQETDIAPGEYVRLSFSDDGDGMSEEAQRRAFEPFFTTKSDSGGSGLGLAMVYGFVRQSGGHITLYSEEGHGTTFGLYFPVVQDKASADAASQAERGQSGQELQVKGRTVLVVEDNPKVRALSVERVRQLGFETESAESGDAAYALLRSGLHVDIVFSDLVMPGALNGYDLAEKIALEFPGIKVLLTSGYASDVVTGRLKHTHHFDILHKPYRQTELAQRLQALLASGFGPED